MDHPLNPQDLKCAHILRGQTPLATDVSVIPRQHCQPGATFCYTFHSWTICPRTLPQISYTVISQSSTRSSLLSVPTKSWVYFLCVRLGWCLQNSKALRQTLIMISSEIERMPKDGGDSECLSGGR